MKIRIGMRQLNDTDKEKIKLGIKKIQDYEQEWLSKAQYENIREIEMSPDEWKKVVENLPHKEINTNQEIYLVNGGDAICHPYNYNTIVRHDNKVTIQGNYVDQVTARFIIDLLVACTYELYREPEQPTPQPQKHIEPKLTPEQIQENKIRDIEKQIAEEVKAIELAKTLNLSEQITAHEDELEYLRKKLVVVRADYEHANWNEDKYDSKELEKYTGIVPLFALEELQKAIDLFDDFRVWVERDDSDPALVGRIICGEHKTPYVIAEWN